MKSLIIAQVAHAINAAYCLSIGDDTQKPWDEASEGQQASALAGVEFRLANLEAPASAQHENWAVQKTVDGWVYGEEKNEEAKTHPCLVDFDKLPAEQQVKDYLFAATVKALAAIPEPVAPVVAPVEIPAAKESAKQAKAVALGVPDGFTPITYIGKRDSYTDGTYGTNIRFEQGETKLVPTDKANLFLKHPDQYKIGDGKAAKIAEPVKPVSKKEKDTEDSLLEARDLVANMNINALRSYAATNFAGHKIPVGIKTDAARSLVVGLIDQYGVK